MDYINELIEAKNRKHDKLMKWYAYKYKNNVLLAELEYDDIYTKARILLREIVIVKRETLPVCRFNEFMVERFDNYFKKSLHNRVKSWLDNGYEKRLWNKKLRIPINLYSLDFIPQNQQDKGTQWINFSEFIPHPVDNPAKVDLRLDLERKISALSSKSKCIVQEILYPTPETVKQARRQFQKKADSGRNNLRISFEHIRKTLGLSVVDFRKCRREIKKKLKW